MGSPLVRVSISAISPSFQCRRCNCQTPSPISSAKAASIRAVSPARLFVRIRAALFGDELALFGLVPELERDERALEGPKQDERQDDCERAPYRRVQPIWRRVTHLGEQRDAGHHETGHQDTEPPSCAAVIGK